MSTQNQRSYPHAHTPHPIQGQFRSRVKRHLGSSSLPPSLHPSLPLPLSLSLTHTHTHTHTHTDTRTYTHTNEREQRRGGCRCLLTFPSQRQGHSQHPMRVRARE